MENQSNEETLVKKMAELYVTYRKHHYTEEKERLLLHIDRSNSAQSSQEEIRCRHICGSMGQQVRLF